MKKVKIKSIGAITKSEQYIIWAQKWSGSQIKNICVGSPFESDSITAISYFDIIWYKAKARLNNLGYVPKQSLFYNSKSGDKLLDLWIRLYKGNLFEKTLIEGFNIIKNEFNLQKKHDTALLEAEARFKGVFPPIWEELWGLGEIKQDKRTFEALDLPNTFVNIDGYIGDNLVDIKIPKALIEVKNSDIMSERISDLAHRYYWQIQLYGNVLGVENAYLLVGRGAGAFYLEKITIKEDAYNHIKKAVLVSENKIDILLELHGKKKINLNDDNNKYFIDKKNKSHIYKGGV